MGWAWDGGARVASSHTLSPAGPKTVRGTLWSPQPGRGFPHSDPVVKGAWQEARVPPAAGDRASLATHCNPFFGSVSSCWGLERVSHSSQPVTSGLLPAPSHGSEEQSPPLDHPPPGAPGCQHRTRLHSQFSRRTPVHAATARPRELEVGLPGCPSRLLSAAVKLAS